MWNEFHVKGAAVLYFKALTQQLPGNTEENYKTFSEKNTYQGKEQNSGLPKYDAGELNLFNHEVRCYSVFQYICGP